MAEQIKGIAASPEWVEATPELVRQQDSDDPGSGVTHAEVAAALAEFSRLWDTLSSGEKSRVLSLLVEQVVYDGVAGQGAITFWPLGLQSLGAGLGSGREVAA